MPKITREFDPERLLDVAQSELIRRITATSAPCLILLSGGSASVLSDVLCQQVQAGQLANIMVGLIDERYGAIGHPHANAVEMERRNRLWSVFQTHGVEARQILTGGGMEDEVSGYEAWLRKAFMLCPTRIGILGVGADGHVAGMLPMPEANFKRVFETERFVAGYDADGQYLQRITMTPVGLGQLTDVLVFAVGTNEEQVLRQALMEEPKTMLWQLPSVLLRDLKHVELFTDCDLA